jgi:hypothetical protein
MKEKFVPIPGYEARYKMGNLGTVWSVYKDTPMKPKRNRGGYWYVSLCTGYEKPRTKSVGIARLLAICFVENPNDYPEVAFIDGDKNNLKVENLEWTPHNWNCRKKQGYVYTAWHKSDPGKVLTFYSRRQLIAHIGMAIDTVNSYLLNIPGYYGPNGWAITRTMEKGYGVNRIKPNTIN